MVLHLPVSSLLHVRTVSMTYTLRAEGQPSVWAGETAGCREGVFQSVRLQRYEETFRVTFPSPWCWGTLPSVLDMAIRGGEWARIEYGGGSVESWQTKCQLGLIQLPRAGKTECEKNTKPERLQKKFVAWVKIFFLEVEKFHHGSGDKIIEFSKVFQQRAERTFQ